MRRIVDVDMKLKTNNIDTALNKFFKKFPELVYWKEHLEYMAANNQDFDSDKIFADGEINNEWAWALHLDIEEDYIYIAVIERA